MRISEELNERLSGMPNQSKFMREAIENGFRKRVFAITFRCYNDKGKYVTTSYVSVKALKFDIELKEEIKEYESVLNEAESREGFFWCFDSLSEKEK